MSALHEAVARAIADAVVESYNVPRKGGGFYTDSALRAEHQARLAAAVAIRVVLAEATQSIEALPTHTPMGSALGTLEWRRDALAALASLSRI